MKYHHHGIGHEGSNSPNRQPNEQELPCGTEVEWRFLAGFLWRWWRDLLPPRSDLIFGIPNLGFKGGGSNAVGSEGGKEKNDQDNGGAGVEV